MNTETEAPNAATEGQGSGSRAKRKRTLRKPSRGVFERPKGSGDWWICYIHHGRKYREKIGPNRTLAEETYWKRRNAIREGRFVRHAWNPTWKERVKDYAARHRKLVRDPETINRYERDLSQAPELCNEKMRSLSREHFENYRARRRSEGSPGARRKRRGASIATVNKELSFARAVFYDFLAALEARGEAPIAHPLATRGRSDRPSMFIREPQRPARWLSKAEEARLRTALGPTAWPVVAIALHTGLDRGAICGLQWSAVDLTRRVIHGERRKGRRGDAIPVTVPVNATLLAVLQALPSRLTSEWVFPGEDTSSPLDGRAYDRLTFRPALRRAKIPNFRFKDLRHTFATRLRMDGRADITSIATLLGHTSTRMSERYAHADNAHLHALVSALDGAQDSAPSDTKTDTGTDSAANAAS